MTASEVRRIRPHVVIADLAHAVPWPIAPLVQDSGVAFFHHLHRKTIGLQVRAEAAVALNLLERLYPSIYRNWPFVTESESSALDLSLLGVPAERIHRIPPGVDHKIFRPSDKSDPPSIVYFGGLRPYKRPQHVLVALRELVQSGEEVRLDLIGDGPELPRLKELASALDIERRVAFHGRVDDFRLAELVSRATVNLHAAVYEGWGFSILEAAACGVPTVGYAGTGISEAVEDGVTGRLVENGNPLELARAAKEIITAPEGWARKCVDFSRPFSWEHTGALWLELLLSCPGLDPGT